MGHADYLKGLVIFTWVVLIAGGILFSTTADGAIEVTAASVTLTPAPIQIPLPERPETLSDIQTLLQEADETCQLPCFWGIRPSYTPAVDVIEFLEPNADFSSARESYAVEYYFREEGEQESLFSIGVGISDDVASLIEIIVNTPSEWLPAETLELPHLLSIMQSSPQAYISISLGQRRIFLTVAYDEGVLAQYPFTLRIESNNVVSPNNDESFLFCPEIEENAFIKLRLRDENAQFLLEEYGTLSDSVSDKVWPVERMTGIEVEDFVKQIIENPDECVELLSYPELIEMGYEF